MKSQRGDVLYHWPTDRIGLVERVGPDWTLIRTTMKKTQLARGRTPSLFIVRVGTLASPPPRPKGKKGGRPPKDKRTKGET